MQGLLGGPVGHTLLRCTKRTEKPGHECQPPSWGQQKGSPLFLAPPNPNTTLCLLWPTAAAGSG